VVLEQLLKKELTEELACELCPDTPISSVYEFMDGSDYHFMNGDQFDFN